MAAITDRGLIGQRMIEANLLVSSQVGELLRYQKESPARISLGRLSVQMGMVTDYEFAPFLASYFEVPYLNLGTHIRIKREILDLLPENLARRYNALPVFKEDNVLFVAMEDPVDLVKIENLTLITGFQVKPIVSSAGQIEQRIDDFYRVDIYRRPEPHRPHIVRQEQEVSPEKDTHSRRVAASFVNLLLERAFKSSVDTVHMQAEDKRVKAYFRINDKLEKIASYPIEILSSISGYLKEISGLNSRKSNIPQTGFFGFRIDDKLMEIGVSIHPTLDGERIVLEIPRRLGWFEGQAN